MDRIELCIHDQDDHFHLHGGEKKRVEIEEPYHERIIFIWYMISMAEVHLHDSDGVE